MIDSSGIRDRISTRQNTDWTWKKDWKSIVISSISPDNRFNNKIRNYIAKYSENLGCTDFDWQCALQKLRILSISLKNCHFWVTVLGSKSPAIAMNTSLHTEVGWRLPKLILIVTGINCSCALRHCKIAWCQKQKQDFSSF